MNLHTTPKVKQPESNTEVPPKIDLAEELAKFLSFIMKRQVLSDFDCARGIIGILALLISMIMLSLSVMSPLPAGLIALGIAFNFLTEPVRR